MARNRTAELFYQGGGAGLGAEVGKKKVDWSKDKKVK